MSLVVEIETSITDDEFRALAVGYPPGSMGLVSGLDGTSVVKVVVALVGQIGKLTDLISTLLDRRAIGTITIKNEKITIERIRPEDLERVAAFIERVGSIQVQLEKGGERGKKKHTETPARPRTRNKASGPRPD